MASHILTPIGEHTKRGLSQNKTRKVRLKRSVIVHMQLELIKIDYVHVNPLKDGFVKRVRDWPYSTFHHHVAKGIYSLDWCGDVGIQVGVGD